MDYEAAAKALRGHAKPVKIEVYRTFFKNSQEDVFVGVNVPATRKVARDFRELPLAEVHRLMRSKVHEERSLANEILRLKFNKGDDGSAPYIVGPYLLRRDKGLLYKLARSSRLWDRRIAIVSTLAFIREGQVDDTMKIAEILLQDEEDLIHKAVGWMLREAGKSDLAALKRFLKTHGCNMPRTMLRYAIERFSKEDRQRYLRETRPIS